MAWMVPIIGSTLVYLVAFVVLRHLRPRGVLFYQGVALAVVLSAAHLAVARGLGQPISEAAKDAALVFLLAYSFVVTVPTTVDRAYSVRMIDRIGARPAGVSRAEVEEWFATEFLRQGGVERRIAEQRLTGTIEQDGDRYRLTRLGRLIDASFHLTRKLFACEGMSR